MKGSRTPDLRRLVRQVRGVRERRTGRHRRPGRHRRSYPRPFAARVPSATVALALVIGVSATGGWLVQYQHVAPDPPSVGIRVGQSVSDYVSRSRVRLHRLAGSRRADRPLIALISLTAYLAPSRAAVVLAHVRTERVYTRVPLPGITSRVAALPVHRVPVDLDRGMDRLADDRRRMASDLDRLATTQPVAEGERREYDVQKQTYRIEAAAYRERCSCVFAAVVRARPAQLLRVLHRPAVRAVEPAPQVDSMAEAVFTPPLPEQAGAGAPTPSGSVVAPTPSPSTAASTPVDATPVPSSPAPTAGNPTPPSASGASPSGAPPPTAASGPTASGPDGSDPPAAESSTVSVAGTRRAVR